ncbi:MAG: M3 family metallopeptidase [Prevotella sp.]|nr:M3 family metallopeptidase [Prevotella sp.]MCI6370150.1 M3 family metallopeptidase [Prevotella sp.]MCI6805618.1 M3 family metallopeptidase [Prevotella sp.]MCI7270498.1 M3 family metallopeptidase [Prevotella sp.]MCI7452534.1 M3 family metallopeptidase [Prevotella sp.]
MRQNPFFSKYTTIHEVPPFDQIKLEDYEEAFMEGIRRDDEHIDKIINNPEPPTFDNTIIEEDDENEYYALLDKVSAVFFNLLSAETNDEMDALAQKIQPALTKHANDVSLNKRLFERIKAVHDNHRPLTPEEECLLQKSYDGFVRSGALLDEEGKAKLRALTEEGSMLSLQFSQNLLKEKKAFSLHITDENDLKGLPDTQKEAARHEAKERNLDGWVFTLDFPSYGPFMQYAENRDLREKMFMAYNTLCTHENETNNIDICKRLINIRRETAQLLGYDTYADYVLVKRMASNVANVYKLLDDLIDAYKPTAVAEKEELKQMAKRMNGEDFKLMPWDGAFYSHKLQLEKYNVDAEMVRPYFELSKVIKGVFGLATRLYGITFQENKDIPVYHPDVKAYEVFDKDGSYLAVLYADFYPRKGKQGGAWMTSYQDQWINQKGENIRPHVSLVMNFTKPTADKPALLTLGEVETFLHEFGHSLHGMFANTRFSSLSGTNVWWDFVELPSQFMENFSLEREFLSTFAYHYKTGEPMPDDLIQRLIDGRNFAVASACLRQVSFGLLDMAYYTKEKPFEDDLIKFEKKAWEKAIIGTQLENTCMTVQFSHIMAGGYSAGYYSYKWAEVLDADAFAVFKREGVFNRETAQRFRDCILSKGGTEHPMTLYKRFRGGEPTIDALLERNGIKKA